MLENDKLSEDIVVERGKTAYLGLYFAAVGDFTCDFYPQERQAEIDSVTDAYLKLQKKTSWKLLEYAVGDIFKKGIEKFYFKKANGKWVSDEFCFSISHSKNLVCVGVSDSPIGVDIESQSNFSNKVKDPFKFFDKIATDSEKESCKNPSIGRLIKLWTGKEANFKRSGLDAFVPAKTEINTQDTKYACVVQEGGFMVSKLSTCEVKDKFNNPKDIDRFVLAVCSDHTSDFNLYFVDLIKNTKAHL